MAGTPIRAARKLAAVESEAMALAVKLVEMMPAGYREHPDPDEPMNWMWNQAALAVVEGAKRITQLGDSLREKAGGRDERDTEAVLRFERMVGSFPAAAVAEKARQADQEDGDQFWQDLQQSIRTVNRPYAEEVAWARAHCLYPITAFTPDVVPSKGCVPFLKTFRADQKAMLQHSQRAGGIEAPEQRPGFKDDGQIIAHIDELLASYRKPAKGDVAGPGEVS